MDAETKEAPDSKVTSERQHVRLDNSHRYWWDCRYGMWLTLTNVYVCVCVRARVCRIGRRR